MHARPHGCSNAGINYIQYFVQKGMRDFTIETARQWHGRLAAAGLQLQRPVRFAPPTEDKMIYNTVNSHRLMEWPVVAAAALARVTC